jgi:hypothetical protein
MKHLARLPGLLVLVAGLGIFPAAASAAAEAPEPGLFGFTGPEILRLDNQISQLRVADLDGDGRNDVVVVNNLRSRINLLYNQTGNPNRAAAAGPKLKRDLNELPSDARFRVESLASEKRIAALVVADLNGDDRPDIAYYGEPKELVVLFNEGAGQWSPPARWPIEDGQISPNSLTTGDVNGDGRTDLMLLADACIYCLEQTSAKALGDPRKIPFSGALKAVQAVDADGDGRSDLLLVNWEDRNPFRVRFQQANGSLGPEIYFPFIPIRSYWADRLAGAQTQVITIAQNSGRAQVSAFVRRPAELLHGAFLEGQFQVLPLQRSDKARRGSLWAEVNGDGRMDLLVAEPESGQLSLFLQQTDGTLDAPKSFPTLAGVSDLAVADWDQDGRPEVFLLSADERQVGVTRLESGMRLPFPTLIPLEGRPLVLAVGRLERGGKPVLALIEDREGKRFLVLHGADGKTRSQALSEKFKSNPVSLTLQDADQDGATDLVILTPYEKVKILRQRESGSFDELDIAPPGGVLEQPWLGAADLDGDEKPELLLTQKNFVRAVVLQRAAPGGDADDEALRNGWTFRVKEQINGATSSSRLAGAAAFPNGTNGVSTLFLLDAERKALTLCERGPGGVWQVVRNLSLPVAEFTSLEPLALGAAQPNTLAFLGLNQIAWLPLQGEVWQLKELDGYETPIKEGHLLDVISGDLDNDGRKDLVFLETARNYLDLVVFDANQKLVPANRWQVFEERTFRGRRGDLPEPREAVVADLTGDGRNDLAILVHDCILLYPQE